MFKARMEILVVSELYFKPYWLKQEITASTKRAMREEMREFINAAKRNGYIVISESITYEEV